MSHRQGFQLTVDMLGKEGLFITHQPVYLTAKFIERKKAKTSLKLFDFALGGVDEGRLSHQYLTMFQLSQDAEWECKMVFIRDLQNLYLTLAVPS